MAKLSRSVLLSTLALVLLVSCQLRPAYGAASDDDDDWGWSSEEEQDTGTGSDQSKKQDHGHGGHSHGHGHGHGHGAGHDHDHDHDDHGAQAAAPPGARAAAASVPEQPMSAAQQSGGNFASYNETCSQPGTIGRQCITSRGLTCTGGLCKCLAGSDGIPMVYINNRDVQRCEPMAHARNRYACSWDQQCREGRYGYFSRCSSGRCTCYDTDGRGRPTVEHENTCFLVKNIGDSCEDDIQCNVTIPGEAICFGSRNQGICQCAGGYFEYEWPMGSGKPKECLPTRSINETCIADAQCSHNDALGELARCSNAQCACYDMLNPIMKTNVSYYIPRPNPNNEKGKCYFLKGANETCKYNQECILGYHPLAVCLQHPSYNGEFVCQCGSQDERKCNSGPGLLVSNLMVIMPLVLVGLISFIFPKHVC